MPLQNAPAPSLQMGAVRSANDVRQTHSREDYTPTQRPATPTLPTPFASSVHLPSGGQDTGPRVKLVVPEGKDGSGSRKRTRRDWRNTLRIVKTHRYFAWIPAKMHWTPMKPVLRCALALWICWIFQLIPATQAMLGYASYFILITAVIVPPWQSVLENLESYANLFFFCGLSWGWSCLAIFIASLTRIPIDPERIEEAEDDLAYLRDIDPRAYQERLIYDGTYIETPPTIICAVFLCVGTAALLCYKLKTQPSPATLPLVLSCILMDVCLVTAHFYPEARYSTGLLFFLPMSISAGVCVLASLVVFPESVGHAFRNKFSNVLNPLAAALSSVEDLFRLAKDSCDDRSLDWDDPEVLDQIHTWADRGQAIRKELLGSLAGIPPLRLEQRYLNIDFSWSCLSGHDLRDVFDLIATVQARSSGLAFFFDVLVNNARHSHIDSSAYSVREASRPPSRGASRPASIRGSLDARAGETPPEDPSQDRSYFLRAFNLRKSSPNLANSMRGSHLSLFEHMTKSQQPVGLYESQRYMELERAFEDQTVNILHQLHILAACSLPLVTACRESLVALHDWLRLVDKKHRPVVQQSTTHLQGALDKYRTERLETIKPFRHLFDPSHAPSDDADPRVTHQRAIFQSYAGQYHTIEFAEAVLKLSRRIEELDAVRSKRRLWYPDPRLLFKHFRDSHQERHVTDAEEHSTDPAFNPQADDALGEAKRRNPEYKPFKSPFMQFLARMASITDLSHSRILMYAIKAGIMTAVTTLPGFVASSSSFYYYNRGIWVTIMSQMTIYSGDTTFALIKRISATFWGGLFGLLAWYIGAANTPGNPYGLAAIGLVTFPPAMMFRLYYPGGLLTSLMGALTFVLVLGYSYLNGRLVQLTDATWGWSVAWRRFVTVAIGITVAWLFSYLPPSYSVRRAIRYSYSQSIAAIGTILADVLSHANNHHNHLEENFETRQKLLTWRAKLSKLGTQHEHATYEYSLRGKWPVKRYAALLETLQDTMSLLSQLHHVLSQLDRPWRQAVLERTRLAEHAFLGDVLAVITMCSTSLNMASPIPQITPSPLVARYRAGKVKGLDVPDVSDDLPHLVTVEVLESSEYMRYALAISTTYSLLARLDRIVIICKTLVGESYHVSGVQLEAHNRV